MEIIKKQNGESLVIELKGRLDTVTSPELSEVVDKELEGITDLVFDFESLEYISSAGLRVILSAQRIMNKQGKMKVCKVNEEVMEVFEITGFADVMTIE